MMYGRMQHCSRPQRAATIPHSGFSCGATSVRQPCWEFNSSEIELRPRTSLRKPSSSSTRRQAPLMQIVRLPHGCLRSSGDWRRTNGREIYGECAYCACGDGPVGLNRRRREPRLALIAGLDGESAIRAMRTLSAMQQACLELVVVRGLSIEEVAAMHGISEST